MMRWYNGLNGISVGLMQCEMLFIVLCFSKYMQRLFKN